MSGITLDSYFKRLNPVDSNAPALPEVSWQTCFFILVTLGLNTMAQPGGRVCGIDARYSTYMRSSPFLSIGDVLSIFFRLSYNGLQFNTSPRACVQQVVNDRFESNGSVDGLESLTSTTWMRWLLFILGPLPQAVRLASFEGVPLTQLWIWLRLIVAFGGDHGFYFVKE
jgi:hypothetical protein